MIENFELKSNMFETETYIGYVPSGHRLKALNLTMTINNETATTALSLEISSYINFRLSVEAAIKTLLHHLLGEKIEVENAAEFP